MKFRRNLFFLQRPVHHQKKTNLIDKILSDDFIIIALIVILIMERLNLKKDGADKNVLGDYDLMIAALIYIYF